MDDKNLERIAKEAENYSSEILDATDVAVVQARMIIQGLKEVSNAPLATIQLAKEIFELKPSLRALLVKQHFGLSGARSVKEASVVHQEYLIQDVLIAVELERSGKVWAVQGSISQWNPTFLLLHNELEVEVETGWFDLGNVSLPTQLFLFSDTSILEFELRSPEEF